MPLRAMEVPNRLLVLAAEAADDDARAPARAARRGRAQRQHDRAAGVPPSCATVPGAAAARLRVRRQAARSDRVVHRLTRPAPSSPRPPGRSPLAPRRLRPAAARSLAACASSDCRSWPAPRSVRWCCWTRSRSSRFSADGGPIGRVRSTEGRRRRAAAASSPRVRACRDAPDAASTSGPLGLGGRAAAPPPARSPPRPAPASRRRSRSIAASSSTSAARSTSSFRNSTSSVRSWTPASRIRAAARECVRPRAALRRVGDRLGAGAGVASAARIDGNSPSAQRLVRRARGVRSEARECDRPPLRKAACHRCRRESGGRNTSAPSARCP